MAPRAPGTRRLCCYIDAQAFGGMERALATLLSGLGSRYEVTIIGSNRSVIEAIATARRGTVTTVVPRVTGKQHVGRIVSQIRAIWRARPDILMASHGQLYSAQYGMLAGIVTRAPTVSVVHCVMPRTDQTQVAIIRWLAQHVARIAGVSKAVCSESETELGLPDGSATLLYNGVPDVDVSEARLPAEAEKQGVPVIGTVGRLSAEKGYDVLIEAMSLLPDTALYLLGEGPMRAQLEALARERGVGDRVHFEGWVDPPWSERWRFDILAIPSRYEGFGLVAVEAMLAGIPVVASDVAGLAEVVSDGRTGLLVEPRRADVLAGAISRVLADNELRKALVTQGRIEARRRFSPEGMVSSYEKVFDEVLAAKSGTGRRWSTRRRRSTS